MLYSQCRPTPLDGSSPKADPIPGPSFFYRDYSYILEKRLVKYNSSKINSAENTEVIVYRIMTTDRLQDFKITLDREGQKKYTKSSYPVRYGRYSEMEYGEFRFQFNLKGEVKHIIGTGPEWPHPAEWLKRTIGNDWVYYSTGSYYSGVVDLFGEYYLPCPIYSSNSLFREDPFARQGVASALQEFAKIGSRMISLSGKENKELQDFYSLVARNSPDYLCQRADRLHRILKARVSVLPPDCRHVDYDVMPLMIMDGCMYNCSFCEVKTGLDLSCRPRREITDQLFALKEFFGPDLSNYNSIYLGQHDALCAEPGDIIFAAEQAYAILDIKKSYMQGPRLFLFGSAESFLRMEEYFWRSLNGLPFYTFVNLGLESFDDETLRFLKKPVSSTVMQKAFKRMFVIKKGYENIEVTANFLLGMDLPANHIPSLITCLSEKGRTEGGAGKGCIYVSPLKGGTNTKELLKQFRTIKQNSRFQTFLYLIQRL